MFSINIIYLIEYQCFRKIILTACRIHNDGLRIAALFLHNGSDLRHMFFYRLVRQPT